MKEIISDLRQKQVISLYREISGDEIRYVVTYEDHRYEIIDLEEIMIWLYQKSA